MDMEVKKSLINSYFKYIKIILACIMISLPKLILDYKFLIISLIIMLSLGASLVCFYYKNKLLAKRSLLSKIIFFTSIVLIIMFISQIILSKYNLAFIEPLNTIVPFSPLIILIVNSINVVLTNNLITRWAEKNSLSIKIGALPSILYTLIAIIILLITTFIIVLDLPDIKSTKTIVSNNKTYIVTEISYNWMHPDWISTTYDEVIIPGFIVKKDVSPY